VSQKKVGYFYFFYDNFGKREPISIIFLLLNSERIFKLRIETTTSLKSVATLPCEK